ncbi:hypothetical protein [Streptomyces sp. NPDC060194]|uniref:hypothetical protein n=1 Tax=Streptomyces sp. NPDC060194 TaxID=3347069 RepID=UPI00365F9F77
MPAGAAPGAESPAFAAPGTPGGAGADARTAGREGEGAGSAGWTAGAEGVEPGPRVVEAGGPGPDARAVGIAGLLHRICTGYAVLGIAVPLFGLATARQLGVLGDAWLIVSIVLTLAAALLLALVILPRQRALLALAGETPEGDPVPAATPSAPAARRAAARLGMLTGIFNLLWVIVTILMIVRPGSTTSV